MSISFLKFSFDKSFSGMTFMATILLWIYYEVIIRVIFEVEATIDFSEASLAQIDIFGHGILVDGFEGRAGFACRGLILHLINRMIILI